MKNLKIETPEGENAENEKKKNAAAGCVSLIIGLALLSLVVYSIYVFFSI